MTFGPPTAINILELCIYIIIHVPHCSYLMIVASCSTRPLHVDDLYLHKSCRGGLMWVVSTDGRGQTNAVLVGFAKRLEA